MIIGPFQPAPLPLARAPQAAVPNPDLFMPMGPPSPLETWPLPSPERPGLTLERDDAGRPRSVNRGDSRSGSAVLLARDADGQPVVLKTEPAGTPAEKRKRDYWWAAQLVASRALQKLGANSLPYHYARTEKLEGLASPFRKFHLLSEHQGPLHNPDGVVRSLVINAWLGDFDRIVKDDNIWVQPDGQVLLGDLGCSAIPGVKAFGSIPKVHLELFARCATPENVAAAVGDVTRLTDGAIRELAREAVSELPDVHRDVAENLARVLIHNRDELRAEDVFAPLMGGKVPERFAVPEELAAELVDAIAARHASAEEAMRGVHGYPPMQGRDLELTGCALANAMERRRQGREAQLELAPSCFFAWHQLAKEALTPRRSLELDLGLKHANPHYIVGHREGLTARGALHSRELPPS